ncbi:MAG: hypothetical protein M1820_001221 [Bogoriella megaspora]|nr:MAG: hypothetical protein M1820_001221 [Bogoriella megaspora]
MVKRPSLPSKHNPLLEEESTPSLEILISRRRLGRTNLAVKPGEVDLTNASKKSNLGLFDYAHLRAPLPENLKGSGVHNHGPGYGPVESYFLMRRSSDGYVSATGMFKTAFPWASAKEETNERKHIASLPTTAQDEVAGNIWIPPEQALELANEYTMQPWIVALLDPEPVEQTSKDAEVSSPPPFKMPKKYRLASGASANGSIDPPPSAKLPASEARSRSLRSASPSKIATPSRKIASPRKRATAKSTARSTSASTKESGAALQSVVADSKEVKETVKESVKEIKESVKEVKEAATRKVSSTTAPVDGSSVTVKVGVKRKAEEITGVDEEPAVVVRAEKKARRNSMETKKQLVRTKALIGLSATVVVG